MFPFEEKKSVRNFQNKILWEMFLFEEKNPSEIFKKNSLGNFPIWKKNPSEIFKKNFVGNFPIWRKKSVRNFQKKISVGNFPIWRKKSVRNFQKKILWEIFPFEEKNPSEIFKKNSVGNFPIWRSLSQQNRSMNRIWSEKIMEFFPNENLTLYVVLNDDGRSLSFDELTDSIGQNTLSVVAGLLESAARARQLGGRRASLDGPILHRQIEGPLGLKKLPARSDKSRRRGPDLLHDGRPSIGVNAGRWRAVAGLGLRVRPVQLVQARLIVNHSPVALACAAPRLDAVRVAGLDAARRPLRPVRPRHYEKQSEKKS